MSAPERIWIAGTLDECGSYYPEAVEAEGEHGGHAVAYILATPEALAASPEVQALIAAEREACAKVADDLAVKWWGEYKDAAHPKRYDTHHEGQSDGAELVAAAIRARGGE